MLPPPANVPRRFGMSGLLSGRRGREGAGASANAIVAGIPAAPSGRRRPAAAASGERAPSGLLDDDRADARPALAARHVAEPRPRRDAFVATSSRREARRAFEAGRAAGPTLARRAAPGDLATVPAAVAEDARARGGEPTEPRPSPRRRAAVAGDRMPERSPREAAARPTLVPAPHGADGMSDRAVDAIEAPEVARLAAPSGESAGLDADRRTAGCTTLAERLGIPPSGDHGAALGARPKPRGAGEAVTARPRNGRTGGRAGIGPDAFHGRGGLSSDRRPPSPTGGDAASDAPVSALLGRAGRAT